MGMSAKKHLSMVSKENVRLPRIIKFFEIKLFKAIDGNLFKKILQCKGTLPRNENLTKL